jgi:hypothetical protein
MPKPETDISFDRLTATEFARLVDPRYPRETEFGVFYAHPEFPDRHDANQLTRCRCQAHEVEGLLGMLEQLYAGLELDFKKISGDDAETYRHLAPVLQRRGWSSHQTAVMIFDRPPARPINPRVHVRVVESASVCEVDALYTEDGALDRGYVFQRSSTG